MHNRRKWWVSVVLIISLLGSLGLTWAYSGNQLSFVVDSYISQGKMYVIDDDSQEINILETDDLGKITGKISLPKQKDGTFAVLDYLNVDQGQVYVYKRDREIVSNVILSENVYRCNFAKGELELAWELPVQEWAENPTEQTIFSVKVSQGNLSFFSLDYNPDNFAAQAILHTAGQGEATAQRVAAVNYDIGIGFTNFFHADNGKIIFTTPNGEIFQAISPDGSQGTVNLPEIKTEETAAASAAPAETAAPQNLGNEPATKGEKPAVSAETPETSAVPAKSQEFGKEPVEIPGTQTASLEPLDFGREPEVGAETPAVSVEPEPQVPDSEAADDGEKANEAAVGSETNAVVPQPSSSPAMSLPARESSPEQELTDVTAALARGLESEMVGTPVPAETGFKVLEARRIFPALGDTGKSQIVNFSGNGNTIYYMDLQRNGLYSFDLAEEREKAVFEGWSHFTRSDGSLLAFHDLINLRFTDNAHFTATVETGQGNSVLGVVADGVVTIHEQLALPDGDLVLKGVLYFLGILFGFLILYVCKEFFLLLTKGKVPIISKLIVAFIPVVVISIFALQGIMNNLFVNELVDKQYKELFLVSRQQVHAVSPQLLAEIDLENPYENVYYYTLRHLLTSLPDHSILFDESGAAEQQVHNFSYNWLYKVEDGKLYSLFCDQNYLNVPIEYYYDKSTTELYYQAIAKNRTLRGDFQDVGGNWIVLAIPLADDQGKVYAVMETGITKAALEYTVAQNTKKIGAVNLTVLLVLIILLTGILMRSLAPLKTLKESVQEIINGRLGIQTPVRGNDEVAEIGKVFNQMSTSIEFHVNELTDLNEGYYKFVPSKMFNLLRKSSVIDVRLGDQTREDITIFSFDAVKFEELVSTMNGEEMFNLINQIFSNLVPIVNSNGGVVDKFENAGLVAFYTGGNERALVTAISVCQTMDRLNAEGGFGSDRQIEIAGGLSYGPVMIGIVGHEERLAATTISEHTNLSRYLREIAPRYGVRILTTAAAIDRIEDFHEKFNARFIGFLHIRANNTLEKLYDVFDGDQEDKKLFKKQTKELFEKGVNLYCQKEYYEARLVFIEVLKQFRQDAAAKEYLYRCDSYYQLQDTEQIEIFIEEY